MKYYALYLLLFLFFIWTLMNSGDYSLLNAVLGTLTFAVCLWGLAHSYLWLEHRTGRTIPRANGAQAVYFIIAIGGLMLFMNYVQNQDPLLNMVALIGFVYFGRFAALLLFGVRKQEPDSL